METQIEVFTSDGGKTSFDQGNLNFNREQLLITLNNSESVTGWHWDHMACILQYACQETKPGHIRKCVVNLIFADGQTRNVEIEKFQAVELKMANSLMIVRGASQTAIVNPDFLNWYRIREVK